MPLSREEWTAHADAANKLMNSWPEWKLRYMYGTLRPPDWVGSEEGYKIWREEIRRKANPEIREDADVFLPLKRPRRLL